MKCHTINTFIYGVSDVVSQQDSTKKGIQK